MKTTFAVTSTDNTTTLRGICWENPATATPRGIVQLLHGMAEHIERYDEFARFLVSQGFIVVGHDHLGHGHSVHQTEPRHGFFTQEKSPDVVVADAYQVTALMQARYPELPYYVLGHSMGSFVLRNYLTLHSQQINGAIIMGTGGPQPALKLALPLVTALNRWAPAQTNHVLDQLAFASFSKHFPEKRSAFDWLSKNQANVDHYLADPLAGFVFTNNGFYTLFHLMARATAKNWFTHVEKTLPLLIMSGEQDPVGDFGRAPRQLAQTLSGAGFSAVTLHLYPQLRHEILQETEKALVMSDIAHWLKKN